MHACTQNQGGGGGGSVRGGGVQIAEDMDAALGESQPNSTVAPAITNTVLLYISCIYKININRALV